MTQRVRGAAAGPLRYTGSAVTAFAIAAWSILPVLALLGQAIWRLLPLALEPLQAGGLSAGQWMLYAGWVLFSMYAEGYRGFQKGFSPRVVARALHLVRHPRPLHVLFAPLFCMSLFHASRRGLTLAWGVLCMVALFVTLVRFLPQPWRGIIDGGVVIGLLWGAVALVVHALRALAGREPDVPPELPTELAGAAPAGS